MNLHVINEKYDHIHFVYHFTVPLNVKIVFPSHSSSIPKVGLEHAQNLSPDSIERWSAVLINTSPSCQYEMKGFFKAGLI